MVAGEWTTAAASAASRSNGSQPDASPVRMEASGFVPIRAHDYVSPNRRGSLSREIAQASEAHSAVQLQTFTRWWNSWLAPRSMPVVDLCAQCRTGVYPFRLLEALELLPTAPVARGSFSTLGIKVIARPQMRVQRLENLQLFLKHLVEVKQIRLVNIGAEDLEEGSTSLVLGLTWALILRYEVHQFGGNETEMLCECDSAAPEEDCAVDTWTDVLNGRQVPAQPLVFRRHFREVSFKVSSDFRQYG